MSTQNSAEKAPELPANVVAPSFSVVDAPVENWFRLLPTLVAQGLSTEECANKLGVSVGKIKSARGTPAFAKLLAAEAQNSGKDIVPELLQAFSVDAVLVLAEIMNDRNVNPNVRVSSAKELLERFCGKAPTTQKSKSKGILGEFHSDDPTEIAKMIDRQIASLLEQRGKSST